MVGYATSRTALGLALVAAVLVTLLGSVTARSSSGLRGFVDGRARNGYQAHWRPLTDAEMSEWVDNEALVKLYVALKDKQDGIRQLEAAVMAASDPDLPTYGQHLDWEQVNALVAPGQEDVALVEAWLQESGVEQWEVMPTRSWIRLFASVDSLQRLLKCRIQHYTPVNKRTDDSKRPTVIRRCEGDLYKVPAELDHIVDFAAPIVGFPKANGKKALYTAHGKRQDPNQPDVTPELLQKLYNLTLPTASQGVNNTQAVFEIEDSYSYDDLQAFFKEYAPTLANQKVVGTLGNKPNDPTDPDTEASLDIQYIMAVGAFAPSYSYNYKIDDDDVIKTFFDWVTDLANDAKPPLVHSVSYGEYGGDYPIDEVMRVSNEWLKLSGRGVTIMFASGDDGVGCNDDCNSFEFPYPSSPWITLVGSTQVNQQAGVFTEIGSDFSSGGFSSDFITPTWQRTQVNYYLDNCPNLPAPSFYNRSGRALPDLAAAGENVQVFVGGDVQNVAGTSCSSPIFAGMVTLWNAIRLQSNKQPMGFINPFLYKAQSTAGSYYDVTKGSNPDECCPGFSAFKGWDPVTGLGTPNYAVLTTLVKALP